MKTKLEIINETVIYYSEDPKDKRGQMAISPERTICSYLTPEGKMCAIGRVASNPSELQKYTKGGSIGVYFDDYTHLIDEVLNPEYHGHSIEFWSDIQKLHDRNNYWNHIDKGITQMGLDYVEKMKEKWKNN